MQLSLLAEFDSAKGEQLSRLEEELVGVPQIELSYRVGKPITGLRRITCSDDCAAAFRENWESDKMEFVEQFKVLLLNRNNRVLGEYGVSTGGVSGTVVDIKLILAAALLSCASAIILGHNHPSGNTQPSAVDKALTKRVREAAAQMDIAVLDHIILTADSFYSFADDGEL
ncbi:JAB domain-containing protein [Rufibacter sediminis]|uniref:JAB domain-containing protein n=1 Tax=Rufibacter sediminis TaxID=2762756 RepID=A0ABR6VP33_9BACT|nr:JAB domain-containing protein [Rufibacter sediminis]MBC3538949.1 JAB domain-containing protein [Rufibacter sediminis]